MPTASATGVALSLSAGSRHFGRSHLRGQACQPAAAGLHHRHMRYGSACVLGQQRFLVAQAQERRNPCKPLLFVDFSGVGAGITLDCLQRGAVNREKFMLCSCRWARLGLS